MKKINNHKYIYKGVEVTKDNDFYEVQVYTKGYSLPIKE